MNRVVAFIELGKGLYREESLQKMKIQQTYLKCKKDNEQTKHQAKSITNIIFGNLHEKLKLSE